MTTFVRFSLLATTALTLGTAVADAAPEVRDHRDSTPAPVVRDHRDAPPAGAVRYRKRPGPRLMMPLKIDLGASGANTFRGFAPGIGGAIGIHWASLSPRPTSTDVGVGVFGALLTAPDDTAVMDDGNGVAYGGAYLEVAQTLARGSFWRTWAAGRGEYVGSSAFGESHVGFGATGRLSAELFVGGAGISPRGVFLGTYAIGVYAELGVRDMTAGVGNVHAGGGLTFRTPLVFGR